MGNRPSSQPSGGPGILEVETTGQTIYSQRLSGEIQTGEALALHGLEIHLVQAHATAGDELVLEQALALEGLMPGTKFFSQAAQFNFGKVSPIQRGGNPGRF